MWCHEGWVHDSVRQVKRRDNYLLKSGEKKSNKLVEK